jgi:large subunit ribosomal protein L30
VSAKKTLRVKQVRSAIGFDRRQRATLRGLGLRRLQQTVQLEDKPAVRGMVSRVRHLVQILKDSDDAG